MSIALCSLPDEFLFLVTNKLYFHELCRLRRTCSRLDSFMEERRHRYTIHSKIGMFIIFDAIPNGSRIQDMKQGEVIICLPRNVYVYVADPYSQLSAVYFDYIRFCTYSDPMKSEKLAFPIDKLYEKGEAKCYFKKRDETMRVIDLDIEKLLSLMRLRCQLLSLMPCQIERNYWLYLSAITFRSLIFGIIPPMLLTVEDLKRLAFTKCQNITSKFGFITEEMFTAFGAFSKVSIISQEPSGAANWPNCYIEKLLAGETFGCLSEFSFSSEDDVGVMLRSNSNAVELYKSQNLEIYLLLLPNNQFAFLCFEDHNFNQMYVALTDLDNLWRYAQKSRCGLHINAPTDFSSLTGNSLEQTIEKYQRYFQHSLALTWCKFYDSE